MELKGVYTALATPFAGGAVDYDKLRELVALQVAGGVDGIVPVGTSGESPTLSTTEHMKVISETIAAANGKCFIMAGTGANSTEEAIELTKHAKEEGADCSLQVTPYYNKPTQEGLYRHFSTIADKCGIPLVLYNVPGRTGTAIAPETIARLSKNANVLGVKEAGGSVERVSEIASLCDIPIMCGDDSLTVQGRDQRGVEHHPRGPQDHGGCLRERRFRHGAEVSQTLLPAVQGPLHRIEPDPGESRDGDSGHDQRRISAAAVRNGSGEPGKTQGDLIQSPGQKSVKTGVENVCKNRFSR